MNQLTTSTKTLGIVFNIPVNYPSVYKYQVEFSPSISSKQKRNATLSSYKAKSIIGSLIYWNDSINVLYIPKRIESINSGVENYVQFKCSFPWTEGRVITVSLTLLQSLLANSESLLPLYNGLMCKIIMRQKFVININGTNYYPLDPSTLIDDCWKLREPKNWLKPLTSIHTLSNGRIKLIYHCPFKVLKLKSVWDIILETLEETKNTDNGLVENLQIILERKLIGKIITITYSNRSYTLDGIDLSMKPGDQFVHNGVFGNNRQISYANHLKEYWNVETSDMTQPMIYHKQKFVSRDGIERELNRVYLIPEFCLLTNNNLEKKHEHHEEQEYNTNENLLLYNYITQLSHDQWARNLFCNWNLNITNDIIIEKNLNMTNDILSLSSFKKNNPFAITNNQHHQPEQHRIHQSVDRNHTLNWIILHTKTKNDSKIATDITSRVLTTANSMKMEIYYPKIVELDNMWTPKLFIEACKNEVKIENHDIVIVIASGLVYDDQFRRQCARLFCNDIPVPFHFVHSRSVTDRIVIEEIFSKCCAILWNIRMPLLLLDSYMLIGIDICTSDSVEVGSFGYENNHNNPGRVVVVGFVASQNNDMSKWWSRALLRNVNNKNNHEFNRQLNSTLFIEALIKFNQNNGHFPRKIIIYHHRATVNNVYHGKDNSTCQVIIGLNIGQIVENISAFMRANFRKVPVPQLSYLIVNGRKKVGTDNEGYMTTRITNCNKNKNFYLISQRLNCPTTKFTLVVPEEKFSQQQLQLRHHQQIAQAISYDENNKDNDEYIEIPIPCYYASKLATFTGQNLFKEANLRLADKLYYI